jgi:hypothetical protein
MASYLGISIAALRNYESGQVQHPDAKAAFAYMRIAGLHRLFRTFELALHRALGVPDEYEFLIRRRDPTGEEPLNERGQSLKGRKRKSQKTAGRSHPS